MCNVKGSFNDMALSKEQFTNKVLSKEQFQKFIDNTQRVVHGQCYSKEKSIQQIWH